ncbi:unnamed protein product [Phaeothamnion confervicola]
MQLSATRFIKIDGTSVTANVRSASEAKLAAKEVRQKKREYQHIKKGLARALKEAERRAGKGGARPANLLSRMRHALGVFGRATAQTSAANLAEEFVRAEEILHNLDAVLIQIQGKLLHYS